MTFQSGYVASCVFYFLGGLADILSNHQWGYTTLWNLLDYPSIIMPLKDFSIGPADDPKNSSYQPRDNAFDRKNWELCELI